MTGAAELPRVLVDASNVAHATEGGEARLENIKLVQKKLRDEGFEPLIVADAALRHQIDEKNEYERLIDDGKVHQAPAGTDADFFILSFARELEARILTNDRFRDRAREFAEERDRVIRFMIVDGEVVLEYRNRRRK
jgi:Zc3h12a-like ribonuclease protein